MPQGYYSGVKLKLSNPLTLFQQGYYQGRMLKLSGSCSGSAIWLSLQSVAKIKKYNKYIYKKLIYLVYTIYYLNDTIYVYLWVGEWDGGGGEW